jgi:hypothetical protein
MQRCAYPAKHSGSYIGSMFDKKGKVITSIETTDRYSFLGLQGTYAALINSNYYNSIILTACQGFKPINLKLAARFVFGEFFFRQLMNSDRY